MTGQPTAWSVATANERDAESPPRDQVKKVFDEIYRAAEGASPSRGGSMVNVVERWSRAVDEVAKRFGVRREVIEPILRERSCPHPGGAVPTPLAIASRASTTPRTPAPGSRRSGAGSVTPGQMPFQLSQIEMHPNMGGLVQPNIGTRAAGEVEEDWSDRES